MSRRGDNVLKAEHDVSKIENDVLKKDKQKTLDAYDVLKSEYDVLKSETQKTLDAYDVSKSEYDELKSETQKTLDAYDVLMDMCKKSEHDNREIDSKYNGLLEEHEQKYARLLSGYENKYAGVIIKQADKYAKLMVMNELKNRAIKGLMVSIFGLTVVLIIVCV